MKATPGKPELSTPLDKLRALGIEIPAHVRVKSAKIAKAVPGELVVIASFRVFSRK